MFTKPFRFIPKNPDKYVGDVANIIMRSSWERKFAIWADLNSFVKKWGSEIKAIPYYYSVDQKIHHYYPDFWILLNNNKRYIIEIKPDVQTKPPKQSRDKSRYIQECLQYQKNVDKWKAAKEFAIKNGFEFMIFTEKELGIK